MARWDGSTGLPKGLVQIMRTWGGRGGPHHVRASPWEDKGLGDTARKVGVTPREQHMVMGTSSAGMFFLQDLLSSLRLQKKNK